jgi:hypothetical protein
MIILDMANIIIIVVIVIIIIVLVVVSSSSSSSSSSITVLWESFFSIWKVVFIKDTSNNLWIISGIIIYIYFLYIDIVIFIKSFA